MCVFSLDDGMVVESWYAWLAFRIRVSMSAIGSVIVMSGCCLSRRGSSWAGSRGLGAGPLGDQWCIGEVMERPCCRVPRRACEAWGAAGAFLLPGTLADARQLAGVRHLPQADPAQAELAEDRVRATAPLAPGVAADRELRLAGRLVDESLLGHLLCLLPRLSGSCSRRSGRRRGTRAGGAARDPPRRSWRRGTARWSCPGSG